MRESVYICYRRIKAFFYSLCYYICRIFPINNDKVTVTSYEGKGGYGCNPKYIVEKLHEKKPSMKCFWLVNDMNKEFPNYVIKVPNTTWNRAYHLSTSKIWIDNYRKPYGTVKRCKQYYFNTWHGDVGFKAIGLWRGDGFSKMAYLVSKRDSNMIDRVIIDSEYSAIMMRKGLIYNGEYLKVGQPRCDILHGDRDKQRELFRKKYAIDMETKLLLYAPTFREGNKDGKRRVYSAECSLDFRRLLNSLKKRFGEQWVICLKLHPQLCTHEKNNLRDEHIIDISKEEDMYQALASMDALITDYSSVAFEASYFYLPVFIYADDIKEYSDSRGDMLWMLSEETERKVENNTTVTPNIHMVLPFPIAKNNDELEQRINDFDFCEYSDAVNEMIKQLGLIFDGNASEKVADEIIRYSRL